MLTIQGVIWLGIWLILLPFLGIPGTWKDKLFAFTGIVILGVACHAYYMQARPHARTTKTDTESVSTQ